METSFYKIDEISDLFVDAFLTEQTQLSFLSVWGRDTSLQEFFARLSLPKSEQGLKEIHLENLATRQTHFVNIPDIDDFEKINGRVQTNVLGQLSHVFIYHKLAVKADALNNQALLFYRDKKPDFWNLVKEACHLPLLEHWQSILLPKFEAKGWIQYFQGIGINSVKIRFVQSELESLLEGLIKSGQLTLRDGEPAPIQAVKHNSSGFWADAAVIHTYDRQDMFNDGFLVDVTERARESGFCFPVALTRTVWDDCVQWCDDDSERQVYQDNSEDPMASGRLSDVINMASMAIQFLSDQPVGQYHQNSLTKVSEQQYQYKILRIPRDGQSRQPEEVELKMFVGPGDDAEPVITIMFPYED